MGDLTWTRRGSFGFPLKALRLHAIALGSSGSGKTETLFRAAYGARKMYHQQVIYLDAKGETKREDEAGQDNAARFVATMQAAGAQNIHVFPAMHYNGWHGTPAELKNRLLSIIDFSESAYYGDVASNVLDLALGAPTTPRASTYFLANLQFSRLKAIYANNPFQISDFMHYIAERRRSGVQTLLIIDEFNALRMREETSILFEQVRSFGGNLMISAQGYAGLGPHEYAERILDACSTYILHACSDPGQVSRRAGKRFFLETSWSEDKESFSD